MSALTLATAHTYLDAAIRKAMDDFKKPICVSICDPQGFLLAFARAEGAPVRSIQISQGKAYTAARMGVTTEALLARLKREDIAVGYFCDPLLTALPGGSPLKNAAGVAIGAAGVSGLTSAEDQSVTDYLAQLAASIQP